MTTPLPRGGRAPNPTPRTAADRERARLKVARKWAYLACTTTYVPLMHTDLERPLAEMVDELFAALLAEPLDLDAADRIGARIVGLNLVDKKSLQCTIEVLAGPLITDEDVAHFDPERAVRLLAALAAGFVAALRRKTVDEQDSMCRALMEVARKAVRAAEKRRAEFGELTTELTLLRRQLSYQLLHDPLTGLPNRQFFTTRLEEVLNSGTPLTLYRIELNGFSVLEDGLGGPRTDTLLVTIAARLRGVAAEEGTMLARFDRASFAVMQEHTAGSATPAEVVGMLTEALAETTYVADLGLALTANIGVVRSPPHRADLVDFLQAADIALRLAREQGPGRWRLLAPDEEASDRRLLRLAAIMPGALETGQLAVGYRLRVNLADGRPVGVEAYPRWDEAGLTGHECTTLAEQTGLGPQITRWLLRTAGERLRTWHTDLPLSVSLSPHQSAAPDLVDSVIDTLAGVTLPTNRLRLALPTSEVFGGRPGAVDNLTALASFGVRTAVHDFGGDPIALVHLSDLPLRSVSLARRLVAQARRAGGRAATTALTTALTTMTSLVHRAGMTVSVDDLSTAPELEWWRRAGADLATGPLTRFRVDPE